MKTNKKILLSSIVTIVLCLSIIAGSTFALFTSATSIDIEVTSGYVNIDAGLTTPVLYSVKPVADVEATDEVFADADTSYLYDENGKLYSYVKQPGIYFANGGTATLDSATGIITLDKVTPGDKIVFNLTGLNTSDVAVQYRYRIECIEGYDLMKGFVATVEGVKYASMAEYTSEWNPLRVGENINENGVAGIQLALELPVAAGNEYQNDDPTDPMNAKIKLTVEAIQNNADVADTDNTTVKYITDADSKNELLSKLASDEYLHIFVDQDIPDEVVISSDLTDKTIDANGKKLNLSFTPGKDDNGTPDDTSDDTTVPTTLTNVVVKNLDTNTIKIASNVNGDITITDSEFTSDVKLGAGASNAFIAGRGTAADNLDVTVENCIFDGQGVVDNGVYFMNIHNLTVRNCEIKNTKSWAIMNANGSVSGNVVISDCYLENCTGITKGGVEGGAGSGTLSGNFTFANNTMVNCKMKNTYYIDVDLDGVLTFTNNTMDGVVVTPEDMKGINITNP